MNRCDASPTLPVGKLPPDLLARLLARAPIQDSRLLQGPGIGNDCAVVELEEHLLVCKMDPVTFATDALGRYLVRVNANDLATTGATPRWLMITLLLPENRTDASLVEQIMEQVGSACRALGITLIGGHTEITYGLDRPIAVGSLLGLVEPGRLVTPRGARAGDQLLLTKSVPIEATAILARERPERLRTLLMDGDLARAQGYLDRPGISITRDAQVALAAGRVTAMHDPTEGGLATALWELAQASDSVLRFDPARVPVTPLSARVCAALAIDPLCAIASGALLLTAPARHAERICEALIAASIPCAIIGDVREGESQVLRKTSSGWVQFPCPTRDAMAGIFASRSGVGDDERA
jgi:hydrogenase maturation factor